MLKGRGRDPRLVTGNPGTLVPARAPGQPHRAPLAKPEPDYEVVEFPSEQYVNASLQAPPPPPRPPTGHPLEAGASCGLCGGGGAKVRCTECGRRALCASCDDMYHRHPKRRHHQRQALSATQLRDERPPLPPKVVPPVPPPRRHKLAGDRSSASPRPPATPSEQRRATLSSGIPPHLQAHIQNMPANNHVQMPPAHMGSMPYLPSAMTSQAGNLGRNVKTLGYTNTLGPTSALANPWGKPRGSVPGFNAHHNMASPADSWESPESVSPTALWSRPMRRGASVLELNAPCACAHAPAPWRYGSCASLEHASLWPPYPGACCVSHPHVDPRMHPHPHFAPQTPQVVRRAESRAASRAGSRAPRSSRAASPAGSARSRTSRRARRDPSPPLPSSDADSETESSEDTRKVSHNRDRRPDIKERDRRYSDHSIHAKDRERRQTDSTNTQKRERRQESRKQEVSIQIDERRRERVQKQDAPDRREENHHEVLPNSSQEETIEIVEDDSLGPAPPPADCEWQCEHCTFANEPGVRVCVVCCRTPTSKPRPVQTAPVQSAPIQFTPVQSAPVETMEKLTLRDRTPSPARVVFNERHIKQNGDSNIKPQKERYSTACGPSPPREEVPKKINRLVTPSREPSTDRTRHDMGVGPSPPKEVKTTHSGTGPSPPRIIPVVTKSSHSVSVGPSPPRENNSMLSSKKSTGSGTSPPRGESRSSSRNVSNTGTSPPPQSISTQTYEDPGRPRSRAPSRSRRARDRSRSRHSLSSDTRDSSASGGPWVRDSSPADWSAPSPSHRLTRRASHLDLTRGKRRPSYYRSEVPSPEPISSHRAMSMEQLPNGARREASRGLELALLMSEAESAGFSAAEVHAALAQNPAAPLAWLKERWPSLCAGVRAAAARLSPGAAVSARDARAALARHRGAMWPAVTECVQRHRRQGDSVSVEEGRLRGRVWGSPAGADDDAAPPARRDSSDEFEKPTLHHDDWMYLPLDDNVPFDDFHLWDARDSKNGFDYSHNVSSTSLQASNNSDHMSEQKVNVKVKDTASVSENNYPIPSNPQDSANHNNNITERAEDLAQKLKALLMQAGIPSIDETLLVNGLLANNTKLKDTNNNSSLNTDDAQNLRRSSGIDFTQSENDFIQAYNALTRSSPLPNVNKNEDVTILPIPAQPPSVSKELQSSNNAIESNLQNESDVTINNSHNKKYGNANSNTNVGKNLKARDNFQQPAASTLHHKGKELLVNNTSVKSSNQTHTNLNTLVNNRSEEERSNNLSDIVDNTQKLIQQMKEEINSDINSLDGTNLSPSEAENSSNESDVSTDHDSSYTESETGDETDHISSEHKETSSSEDMSENHVDQDNAERIINRTSSEDNEQFEEAMDHIEGQIEDFKQTNIEILDSIAKSLQEEHTVTIEIKDSKLTRKRQDENNNVFTKVNSFDEIYEELSANNVKEIPKQNNAIPTAGNDKNKSTASEPSRSSQSPQIKRIIYTKQDLNFILLRHDSPIRVIVTENKLPIFNAVLETVENELDIKDLVTHDESVEQTASNIHNIRDNNLETISNELTAAVESLATQSLNEEITESNAQNIVDITSNDSNILFIDSDDRGSPPLVDIDSSPQTDIATATTSLRKSISPVPNDPVSSENIEVEMSNSEVNPSVIEEHNVPEKENSASSQESENLDADIPNPEKAYNSNTKSNYNSLKSNIPKLISKVFQSNKKDKAPKVIASKVPVRRGSLKQYAAPAPPKTHFGNIQSGHVKQLQTRLFDNKGSKPKAVAEPKAAAAAAVVAPKAAVAIQPKPAAVTEPKPSTSAVNKKKQAPSPPRQQAKQSSPPSMESPLVEKKKKKQFFRESCRTEDEWSSSDSDESQRAVRPIEQEPIRPPSPPPPLTLRRVSGQLIDLARVTLPEGSPERQARMLLAEGALESWQQAQLAVELVSRGASPPAAMLAALECLDLDAAMVYLHQDCELCASKLPEHEMVSMLRCTHRCCRECARHYFTLQVSERGVADCVCPYCKQPALAALAEDDWLEYFAHLDILLKTLLEPPVHELFQRKLRDRTLARDPNFRWCVECSSGFFVHPKQKRVKCPECRAVSCPNCRKPWSAAHEGASCEQFSRWQADNDPERSLAAVQQHLRDNGLDCPRCQFKYSLSRGGCMHFTCTQCKYEFCFGCGKPFMMGAQCGLSEYCAKLGLHAHHPRNCLFYLRDKEPHELQTLLEMNNVPFEKSHAGGPRCPVPLQRDTPAGLVDTTCGADVPQDHAGMCKMHYVEYLAGLARNVDPLPVMTLPELVAELRRRALPLPERGPWDSDPIYAGMCAEIVKEKIPLD